jgi:hypothetical protein
MGEYWPGIAEAEISNNKIILSNDALIVEWTVRDSVLSIVKLENQYDGTKLPLENVSLFSLEFEDGTILSNKDFKITEKPKLIDVRKSNELPVKALGYSGKKIETILFNKDLGLELVWSAIMRNGSNYVRQMVQLRSLNDTILLKKLNLWDGKVHGAKMVGNVLGTPIIVENYFFGYEHPTSQSNAIHIRKIGKIRYPVDFVSVSKDTIETFKLDITKTLSGTGQFVITYHPHDKTPGFNILSVTLFENEEKIDIDKHMMFGEKENYYYHIDVKDHKPELKYHLEIKLKNVVRNEGDLYLLKYSKDILNFYVEQETELSSGNVVSAWSVVGVAAPGQLRRYFLHYIERERAHPYHQFLHYNGWYDISEAHYVADIPKALNAINQWGEKFIKPYNIDFQSFALDDGWDDYSDLWRFNKDRFPEGFTPLTKEAQKYNSGIGVWMSPFGGYGETKQKRLKSARRDEFEINDAGLSLSGPMYYQRFEETALTFIKKYKVNYFKFDGFGGTDPRFLPDMEAASRLLKTLRKEDPEIFINITVGSWPSPFWLHMVDCTWRGGRDIGHAGVGDNMQKMITYRDGLLYSNVVKRSPLYPLNSIMTIGMVYAKLGIAPEYVNEGDNGFNDQVLSYFGSGTSLQELYISDEKMNDNNWETLAEAVNWAKLNEDILVDTHWIGGNPLSLDVYGWASWHPRKGIITLRNPDDKPQKYSLNLKIVFELPDGSPINYEINRIFHENALVKEISVDTNNEITLNPFEVIILEAHPKDEIEK